MPNITNLLGRPNRYHYFNTRLSFMKTYPTNFLIAQKRLKNPIKLVKKCFVFFKFAEVIHKGLDRYEGQKSLDPN